MGLDDYFPWKLLYEKKVDPLILTTYEEKGKFRISIVDVNENEVRSPPLKEPAAIKETRKLVSAIEEKTYRFAFKDVPDGWLEEK